MSLLVKICGLGNAADVQAAIDAGVDAVGFVFAESPRKILPSKASAAISNLARDVKTVAVMRHPSNAEWQNVLDVFQPDILQTDIEDYEALSVPDTVLRWPVIRESNVNTEGELPAIFLYEGVNSGKGETVDWARAREIALRGKMILAGGLDAQNLHEAVSIVKPYGVDVSSAVESAPGIKDHQLIREFVQAARAAETCI